MKRFLVLLITAASCITASAQNSTSPASMQTGKLDGKTFKITLVAKQSAQAISASGTVTSTTTTEAKDKNADMQGSVNEGIRDEKSVDNPAAMSVTSQDNAAVNNGDYSIYTQPLPSNKTTLSFNNGMLESPMATERKFESCPYKINANEGSMTAFSATCRSATPMATAVWSGMVTGSNIKGSVSYRLGNGQVIDYSYTGTAVVTKKIGSKGKSSSSTETPAGKTE